MSSKERAAIHEKKPTEKAKADNVPALTEAMAW
jgi:hypothetical protein